jgi:hypothetical protein
MKHLFIFLIPFVLLAQTPKQPHPLSPAARGADILIFPGRYCGGGLTEIPQTKFQAIRDYLRGPVKATVHVTFVHDCSSSNPGAIKPAWMWILHIEDVTNKEDSISNLKTLNESATGMDIEGIRGHTINWTVTTR